MKNIKGVYMIGSRGVYLINGKGVHSDATYEVNNEKESLKDVRENIKDILEDFHLCCDNCKHVESNDISICSNCDFFGDNIDIRTKFENKLQRNMLDKIMDIFVAEKHKNI
jgi:hypothetical protein